MTSFMVLSFVLTGYFNKHICSLIFKFDASSEVEILRIPQPGPRQNGGQIFFGPIDGFLYVSTGDGGIQNGSRFDKQSLLGKILRLNLTNGISIPSDNPFVGDASSRSEIFAFGFRNPWRCSVDIKWIICGDVGEPSRNQDHDQDEIDVIVKGGKYGWFDQINAPCSSLELCRQMNYHRPIHSYSHNKGQAVVGGIVYRGTKFPLLNGRYIYADYVHGSLHTLQLNSKNEWVKSDDLCIEFSSEQKKSRQSGELHVSGLFENLKGEIYILVNFGNVNSHETGFIYRLTSNIKSSGTNIGQDYDPLLPLISMCLIIFIF